MAERFFMTCSVCCSMPPVIRFPVAGSKATCPEINKNPLALMPWEYGPMALGALGVKTTSRDCPLIHLPPIELTDKNTKKENRMPAIAGFELHVLEAFGGFFGTKSVP